MLIHSFTPASGSLLSVADLSIAEVRAILAFASTLEAEPAVARAQRLFKRRVALLFYESSTRTPAPRSSSPRKPSAQIPR